MNDRRLLGLALRSNLKRLLIRIGDAFLLWLVEGWGRIRFRRLVKYYRQIAKARRCSPRLATPRSANDKFLWRKVFDHDPRFEVMCAKLSCREWVRAKGLDLGMAELLWVDTTAADIPESVLLGDVVVKPNGGSGRYVFIRGGDYDRAELVRTTRRWLKKPYGRKKYEWGYFNVPRLILVESMIRPDNGVLDELKLYTFGDRIERVVFIRSRFDEIEASIWEPDAGGCLVQSSRAADVADRICRVPLPSSIDRAMEYARILGGEFDHMRVDLYTDGRQLWFSELTVYNQSGRISHTGHDPDSSISRIWDIRRSNFLRNPPSRGWRAWYSAALSRWLEREHR